jgi:hypothetical protein
MGYLMDGWFRVLNVTNQRVVARFPVAASWWIKKKKR